MLELRGYVDLPPPRNDGTSEFDHGDVHRATGRVFVAHTAANTVEIVDGLTHKHLMTIPGCPEGSGVLCAQEEGIVFAAARGAGKALVIEAATGRTLSEITVGPRPNGLAWDIQRKRLLVADVQENQALLLSPVGSSWDSSWQTDLTVPLPVGHGGASMMPHVPAFSSTFVSQRVSQSFQRSAVSRLHCGPFPRQDRMAWTSILMENAPSSPATLE